MGIKKEGPIGIKKEVSMGNKGRRQWWRRPMGKKKEVGGAPRRTDP
jgi:hypothetical protein